MKMNGFGKLIMPVIVLAVFSCKTKKEEPVTSSTKKPPAITRADAFIVSPQPLLQDIEATGNLVAFESTDIHPEISGLVKGIYFKEGAMVQQGSLLVKLNDADLQAQLNKLYVQLKTAEQTVRRYGELLKINGVSQQEYDLNVLAVSNIKADINIVKTNIAKTSVIAPFSGKTGLRNISNGAYITPQTSIVTLRKINQLKLEFTVPEKYGSKIAAGKYVTFNTETGAGNYPARILATESNIDEDSRSLKVKAVVEKMNGNLLPGNFARVRIPLGENYTAFMVPSQAIIPKARNKQVIVLRNGLADLQVVTTGVREAANVEITSGLKSGDTVLTSGLLAIKPGSPVTINKIVNP